MNNLDIVLCVMLSISFVVFLYAYKKKDMDMVLSAYFIASMTAVTRLVSLFFFGV